MAGCSFWGAEPDFSTKSVWFHKVIDNWESWRWEFDPEKNPYWQIILDIMKVFIERNNEEYFIGVPEIGNEGNNLSLIRGASDLAMDTLLNQEACKNAVDMISDSWIDTHKVLYEMSHQSNEEDIVLVWLNLWAPGRHDQIANDSPLAQDSHFKLIMWSWWKRNPVFMILNISYLTFPNVATSQIGTSKTYCFEYQFASIYLNKSNKIF